MSKKKIATYIWLCILIALSPMYIMPIFTAIHAVAMWVYLNPALLALVVIMGISYLIMTKCQNIRFFMLFGMLSVLSSILAIVYMIRIDAWKTTALSNRLNTTEWYEQYDLNDSMEEGAFDQFKETHRADYERESMYQEDPLSFSEIRNYAHKVAKQYFVAFPDVLYAEELDGPNHFAILPILAYRGFPIRTPYVSGAVVIGDNFATSYSIAQMRNGKTILKKPQILVSPYYARIYGKAALQKASPQIKPRSLKTIRLAGSADTDNLRWRIIYGNNRLVEIDAINSDVVVLVPKDGRDTDYISKIDN